MKAENQIKKKLKEYWGYNSFKAKQEEIIKAIIEGKDTLALLPTGGGKSLCFQLPALIKDGICIVISPLIALMNDQVQQLQKRGIKAIAITSGMSKRQIDIGLDNAIYGDYKFLYVSPERLETEVFKERLKKMKVNLVAVDEAHCISQWGYDFRPSYLKIASLRDTLKKTPFIALTATATQRVVLDIQEKLLFAQEHVLKTSFFRKNLAYVVLKEANKEARTIEVIKGVRGSGIIYVKTRKSAKKVSELINSNGISADYYHAGLNYEERNRKQNSWINNQTRVIVATNAFGMGIDKADVRFVIHLDIPQSPEAYFQEVGRGGRDGNKAYAVIMWNKIIDEKQKNEIEVKYPTIEKIRAVYLALGNYFQVPIGAGEGQKFSFDIQLFSKQYKLGIKELKASLKLLDKEGYILLSDQLFQSSMIHIKKNHKNLYTTLIKNKTHSAIIKKLLRTHGGLFDGFVRIDEQETANSLNLSKAEVNKSLKILEERDLIDYMPQTMLPQIIFLKPRLEQKRIIISKENYTHRKKADIMKWESIYNYLENDKVCRSKQLLAYFDEKESENCGICDICLIQKRQRKKGTEKKVTQKKIIAKLTQSKLTSKQILEGFAEKNKKMVLKELSFLVDNKIIESDGYHFWLN